MGNLSVKDKKVLLGQTNKRRQKVSLLKFPIRNGCNDLLTPLKKAFFSFLEDQISILSAQKLSQMNGFLTSSAVNEMPEGKNYTACNPDFYSVAPFMDLAIRRREKSVFIKDHILYSNFVYQIEYPKTQIK